MGRNQQSSKALWLFLVFTLSAAPVFAQKVEDPKASILDVPARQAFLKTTTDPRIRNAIAHLSSCVNTPAIPPPSGRIEIPHHYLSGSHGPVNPAEAVATRVYTAYEKRITAGMNQWLATGSHAEAACSLAQLDSWAQAKALLDYDPKESSQAWYQVEWTLGSSGVTDSVLVNDPALDPAQQDRVAAWLNVAAHKLISFEKPGEPGNNHHYFRALAATSVGIVTRDNALYHFGVEAFREAISEIDSNGASPREMARFERSTHYQGFALQPLVVIAEFATRQHTDLYAYESHHHTVRDAIVFFGRAIDDPAVVKPYTTETQTTGFGPDDFATFEFYAARFGTADLPPSIVKGLQKPNFATRIGGNTTVIAGR